MPWAYSTSNASIQKAWGPSLYFGLHGNRNTNEAAISIETSTMKFHFSHAVARLAMVLPIAHGQILRFSCSQLVVERLDPLVNPGMNPSTHLHQIIGGVRERLHVMYKKDADQPRIERLQRLDGPQDTGPSIGGNMHQLPVCRRLLELLDSRSVLPSSKRYIPPSQPEAQCWFRASDRRHDGVLQFKLQWWESHCFQACESLPIPYYKGLD